MRPYSEQLCDGMQDSHGPEFAAAADGIPSRRGEVHVYQMAPLMKGMGTVEICLLSRA